MEISKIRLRQLLDRYREYKECNASQEALTMIAIKIADELLKCTAKDKP